MKVYQIVFFILKTIVSIHLLVILFMGKNRQDFGYIINETIFKIAIGTFLGFYFFVHPSGLEFEDRVIISIAGFVILYDINWERLYQELL
jgi:hypothetical protein